LSLTEYDPIHAAMAAAGDDCTASDLLWAGYSPIGFGVTGGNGVKPGRKMSDDMPERFKKLREYNEACKLVALQRVTPEGQLELFNELRRLGL